MQEKAPLEKRSNGRKISMAEIEKHASKESAWFVRDGKVCLLLLYLALGTSMRPCYS